ncbi:MAG: tRNA 2-thiocytidine biosynthesis protein TtcA [Lachnospiraceae bacterium]|nr:tRNA 2-thiocytidine biosynthesis protein TtcA [Lachnospiraceae bacterium]
MDLQKLLSLTRRCIDTYSLISEGDHIAVGVSAGKDSLSLLMALKALQRFYPKHFELSAITVDLGLGNLDLEPVKKLAEDLGVPYHIVPTQIGDVLFEIRKESNPCALCAKLRKGALDDKALEISANKIAYAHHKDDLIETAFLSMLYEGRFYSFSPLTYLDRTKLTVIRPFIFIDEADIISFAKKQGLPVCKNPCPMDGYTRRQYVKELLRRIYEEVPGADKRLFRAVIDGNIPGWPPANPNPRYNKQ